MTLFFKRKINFHSDLFEVLDENSSVLYSADGDIKGKQVTLRLQDAQGNQLVEIHEKQTPNQPTVDITINQTLSATLSKKKIKAEQHFIVNSQEGQFLVKQDFSGLDYEILLNGTGIGSVTSDRTSWKDISILTLNSDKNTTFVVAMLLALVTLIDHEEEILS